MGPIEFLLIALGLSMDAVAVSICKGLSAGGAKWKGALTVGLYFGIFQAGMPLLGGLVAGRFADSIAAFDHWIAFGLLALIGGKMIWENRPGNCAEEAPDASLSFKAMLPLAFATSIDALAVGVPLKLLGVSIVPTSLFIGVTTLALSMIGFTAGGALGAKVRSKAELFGGVVLVLIGVKILLTA